MNSENLCVYFKGLENLTQNVPNLENYTLYTYRVNIKDRLFSNILLTVKTALV